MQETYLSSRKIKCKKFFGKYFENLILWGACGQAERKFRISTREPDSDNADVGKNFVKTKVEFLR